MPRQISGFVSIRQLTKTERTGLSAQVCKEGVMEAGERAAAENQGADRASGFVVGDADVATARIFVDSHLWNDRNAHAGADHTQNTAELPALEHHLWI